MNSEQMFFLLQSLSDKEKVETHKQLVKLLGSKRGLGLQLYQEIKRPQRWSKKAEKKCSDLFADYRPYYNARRTLAQNLLRVISQLKKKTNTSYNYDFIIEQSLLGFVLKTFVEDVEQLLAAGEYDTTAVLLEKAEDAIHRSGTDKDAKKLAHLPSAYQVKCWAMEEAKIREGIREVRAASKLPAAEKIQVAKQLMREYRDTPATKPKAQRIHQGLMARILYLAGDHEKAVEEGVKSLDAAFEVGIKSPLEVLDGFSYIVPMLIDIGKSEKASHFLMRIPTLKLSKKWQVDLRGRIELESLILIALEFNNLDFASKARKRLAQNNLITGDYLRLKYLYSIALTFFTSGEYQMSSRILNQDIKYSGKKYHEIRWHIECLKMVSFYKRSEEELCIQKIRVLKSFLPTDRSDFHTMIYECIESLIKLPFSERTPVLRDWGIKIKLIQEKPANVRFRRFFDIGVFLKACDRMTTMADIAEHSQRVIRYDVKAK